MSAGRRFYHPLAWISNSRTKLYKGYRTKDILVEEHFTEGGFGESVLKKSGSSELVERGREAWKRSKPTNTQWIVTLVGPTSRCSSPTSISLLFPLWTADKSSSAVASSVILPCGSQRQDISSTPRVVQSPSSGTNCLGFRSCLHSLLAWDSHGVSTASSVKRG